MKILGLNAWHGDASAALIVDGRLVAAAEEERFTRKKHCAGFPAEAARWCLAEGRIAARDLDHVAISRDPKANRLDKILFALQQRPSWTLIRDRLANAGKVRDARGALLRTLGVPPSVLSAQFHAVEHHRAHMASAFFVSPFEEAAVVSVDGFGDFASLMLGHGRGRRLEVLDRVPFPHSLGLFYTMVTQFLGFPKYGDEGKVMGLAPYGKPQHLEAMREILKDGPGGARFELDLDYFLHHSEGVEMTWEDGTPVIGRVWSDKMVERFGPARVPGAELTDRDRDLAASLQQRLEEVYLGVLRAAAKRTGSTNLALAGGVAFNSVANGKILDETPFKELYIQPAAGDAGTAIGAAFQVLHEVLERPRSFVMKHAYTGPGFGEVRIKAALAAAGLSGRRADAVAEDASDRVASGKVVGWFQGRMEFGPRALGNRSILADPRRAEMKKILNERIKHRESFRPFAPVVQLERIGEVFERAYPSPFMNLVYKLRPEARAKLPAVNHVDDTGRLQTLRREDNPRYWDVIEGYRRRTGLPVLLNTSFNENEPIVCTPEDAIRCFQTTKMDCLVLGDWVVDR
ncbi:MAG: carbamoyltransferase [Planctomycetes bacterium]|nr:carbamoyltransferase [Planctomycetota bacterium]